MFSPPSERRHGRERRADDASGPASGAPTRPVPPLNTSLPPPINTGSLSARGQGSGERLTDDLAPQATTARARLLPVMKTPIARAREGDSGDEEEFTDGVHLLDKPAWCFRFVRCPGVLCIFLRAICSAGLLSTGERICENKLYY